MIKLLCIAPPLSGHLFPVIHLMKKIEVDYPRKYQIIIMTGIEKKEYVESQGFEFIQLHKSNPHFTKKLTALTSLFQQYKMMSKDYEKLTDEIVEQLIEIKPDITIVDFVSYHASSAVQYLNLPWITHFATPFIIDTKDGVPSFLKGLRYKDNLTYKTRDKLLNSVQKSTKRTIVRLQKKQLGKYQYKLYDGSGYEKIYSKYGILALGAKELEFPKNWPENMHFVGHGAVSEELEVKFQPGFYVSKKKILITTGTISIDNAEKTYKLFEEIAQKMPEHYFVFTDGNIKSEQVDVKENIERHPFIPYENNLPEFDIVIHHGGAGIVYSTIRHEKYAIVMPNMYDQYDFAARLEYNQLATWIRKRTISNIMNAIDEVEATQPLQVKKQFAQDLAKYNGAKLTNDMIEKILKDN
jgi:UDP:flavonoid glycosyltransferase YjiC (YdhE family)